MSSDVERPEIRIQMFCYYNTLAWQILAATVAAAIVLATLPYAIGLHLRNKDMYFWFNEVFAAVIFAGGFFAYYRLRAYAAIWVQFRNENYPTSLRARIDRVETGHQRASASIRAAITNLFMLLFIVLGAGYVIISALLWFFFLS
jgi:hypothetical protein